MIAFVVSNFVHQYLEDYLNHIARYFDKNFSLNTEIITYEDPNNEKRNSGRKRKTEVYHSRVTGPKKIHKSRKNRTKLLKKMSIPNISDCHKKIIFVQYVNWGLYQKKKDDDCEMFLLNTEQMTVEKYLDKIQKEIEMAKIRVIDYSMENITILKSIFPLIDFIHFPFPIMFEKFEEKTGDIVSLNNSKYRSKVLESLGMYYNDFNNLWKNDRDSLIRQCKALVNIHVNDNYNIFESLRCYHALEMGVLIVSETSDNMDSLLFKDFIIFVSPGRDIEHAISDVLDNYDYYHDQCFSPKRLGLIQKRLLERYTSSLDKLIN